MLRLFASNQPLSNSILPFLAALAVAPHFHHLDLETKAFGAISFEFFYQWPIVALLMQIALLSVIGILTTQLFNNHDFHSRVNFLPGFFLVLIAGSILVPSVGLNQLASLAFVVLGLRPLVSIFRQNRVLDECFRSGLWFGISALLWYPMTLLLPLLIASLVYVRAFNWREHMTALISFMIPFFYQISVVFLFEDIRDPSDVSMIALLTDWKTWNTDLAAADFSYALILGLLSLLGVRQYFKSYKQSSNKARNSKSVFLILGAGILLAVFVNLSIPTACFTSPLISFMLAFAILDIHNRRLSSLVFYLTVLSSLAYSWFQVDWTTWIGG